MKTGAKARLMLRATRRKRTLALRHTRHARDVVHMALGPVADCADPTVLEDVGTAYVQLVHAVERLEELVADCGAAA